METALLSMAQEFSGLPIDALIGGPLNAAAKANAAMALTQTTFMLDTCFVKSTAAPVAPATTGTDSYSPIMIVMSLTRGVITPGDPKVNPPTETKIQSMTTQFNLPLLTIVPLNSLAVDTVDVTFEMEVKSSFAEDTTEQHSKDLKVDASLDAKLGWGPVSVEVKASVSYDQKDSTTHNTHYEKSNSAKYTINVHASQLPLPKGVNIIIEAFAGAIQPITIGEPGKN